MPENANGNASPWRFPGFRILSILLAFFVSFLAFKITLWSASPLQEFYAWRYAQLSVTPDLSHAHFSINRGVPQGKSFPVAFVGQTVATEANFPHLSGVRSVRLVTMQPSEFRAWLKDNIFAGQSFTQTLHAPLYFSETCFVFFYLIGRYFDRRQLGKARKGFLLRGPGLISRWKFNWKTRGDGLSFLLDNRRNLFELLMPADSGKYLKIRRDREAHHIQIAGDTGTGKSVLIRQILSQIDARGEVAIVFDPDREYIKEYFSEQRGDWVLNPLDERCPYWAIEEEATSEAEATPIALSLWPDEPNQQPFFKKHPRAIFAYLISRYGAANCPEDPATCDNLGRWLSNPRVEVTPRLKGTRHAVSTDANAKDQSQGLWATLGEVATPLMMMPPSAEGLRIWTVKKWAKERKGWLFITSTPDTLDAIRPLQSLWLDMLILKLQLESPTPRRVWMILDELAALNQLPQLESALTRQRKYDNPIVLAFQSMAQVAKSYGDKAAETILSQAFTNFVLRAREPRASKHLSDLIGKAQLERLRESTPSRWFQWKQGSFSTERVVDPVVMDSEIQGLDDLNGYFVQKDKIVKIRFHPQPKKKIAPGLVERTVHIPEIVMPEPEVQPVAIVPSTAVQTANGTPIRTAKEQVLGITKALPEPVASNVDIDLFR